MDQSIQKRPGSQNHSPGRRPVSAVYLYTGDVTRLNQEASDIPLAEGQVFLMLQGRLHTKAICLFVRLSPGCLNSRTFTGIQHSKLDPRIVNGPTHFTPKGIDLPDHMALGKAPNCRIAGHLCNTIKVLRDKER
jgi:hypothetical protein